MSSHAGVGADGKGDLESQGGAEGIEPVKELADGAVVAVPGDLVEVINEDVGDIVVAGIEAADEAPEGVKAVDGELGGVHEAGLVAQAEAHVAGGLDADHAAGAGLGGGIHKLQELFGLALTGAAHDQSDHMKSLL